MAVTQIRGSSQIIAESILAGQLAANSVITVKILDKNVTEPKLADGAVSTRALGANVVTEANIATGTITTASINSAAGITLGQLARGGDVILRDGTVAMTAALSLGGNNITNLPTVTDATPVSDAASVGYVQQKFTDLQSAMATGLVYRGVLDATSTFAAQARTGMQAVGDFYKVTVEGTLGGFFPANPSDASAILKVGDMVIVNAAVDRAAITAGDLDKVDNYEDVTTVAGRAGNVVLVASDLTDVTATYAELNYVHGVTSGIQGQIDAKLDRSQLQTAADLGGTGASDSNIPSQLAVKTYVDNATTVAVGAFAVGEVPSGAANGTNAAFAVAHAPKAGSLAVFLNGMRLQQGGTNDYTWTSGLSFTMLQVPQTGDIVLVDYRY